MLLDKWFISRTFQNIKVNFISHQKTAQKENMQLHDRLKSTHIAKAACMQQLAIMPRSGNGICLIVCSFTINPRLPWSQVFFLDGDFISLTPIYLKMAYKLFHLSDRAHINENCMTHLLIPKLLTE